MLHSWQMTKIGEDFVKKTNNLPDCSEGEVLVEVSACGVCHTDLSFWHYGVKTRKELPLTLGHEISGTVLKGEKKWIGKKVVIPAVLPCGHCEICQSGRSNICQNQLMPGNDFDGGFASHVKVPAQFLAEVPGSLLEKYSLSHLAVVADAISTPYQVVEKSELKAGDLAIIIGVGGVGIYAALLAKIKGAKVIALDVDDQKLALAKANGIEALINTREMDFRTLKQNIRNMAKEMGASKYQWKIFEMSGTKTGQETGFGLLTFASTLSIVGFTLDKPEVRLSNLMAFDAKIIGTWGCKPELYANVLQLLDSGQLDINPFVQELPMSKINEVFKNTLQHKYLKRTVLIPDFE